MIKLTATAASVEHAKALVDAGVDYVYVGNNHFGLRLKEDFSLEDIEAVTKEAHARNKGVTVAVNAIMHADKMTEVRPYLHELERIGVDRIEIGDAGLLWVIKEEQLNLPVIYNTQMTITNAKQINFWTKRGAIGAVLGREVPFEEMMKLSGRLNEGTFAEVLVYGATCIHQSRRPLVQNYYHYIQTDEIATDYKRNLFLSEPKKPETHYSIFEDENGTHVFANNDLDLMLKLNDLHQYQFNDWKLDGLYTDDDAFVEIVKCFDTARMHLENGTWNESIATQLDEKVRTLHPEHRGLDEGFFNFSSDDVK